MLESSHLGLLVLAHAPLSRRAWQISDSTGTWETSCGHVSMRHHAIYLLDVLLDLDGFDGCFGLHQHQDQETCKMLGRGFSGALSVWWRPWFGYAYRWFGRALLRRSWFTKVLQIYSRERHIWQLIGDDRDILYIQSGEPKPNVMGWPHVSHFHASAEDAGSWFRQDVTLNLCLGLEFTGAGLQFCGMSGAGDHRKHRHSYFHRKAAGMFSWKAHTNHEEITSKDP